MCAESYRDLAFAEFALWCQSTTRGRRLSLCLPQEGETWGALINILPDLMTGTSDLLPIRRNITVREAYFDAPVLEQLMMDAIGNVSALYHRTKHAVPEAPRGSLVTCQRR